MADSKEVVVFNASRTSNDEIWSPEFIDELLTCSQQVALLYNISYLCLAKFPKCEKLLRMRAVETQLLFGSSEAALLKCAGTSHNLVTSLFPILATAVERNKPIVAVRYLEKAKAWISNLIPDLQQIVEKYEVLIRAVAATTSDIIKEKKETENKINEVSQDIKDITNSISIFKVNLTETTDQLKETESKIDEKNRELQKLVRSATETSKGLSKLVVFVPFVGVIVKAIYDTVTEPGVVEQTKALEAELDQLNSDRTKLKHQEWYFQVELIDWQMKLSKVKTDHGLIPDPVHLSGVQRYLSKIQAIFLKFSQFCKSVDTLLGIIKEKTFVGEGIDDDPHLKDMFLKSIQTASKIWTGFGRRCNQCVQIFRVQSRDAYKFLEIDPNSLSPEEWKKEYDSVMEQLNQLKVIEDETPAIQ